MLLRYLDYIKEASKNDLSSHNVYYTRDYELKEDWNNIRIEGQNGSYKISFNVVDPSDKEEEIGVMLLDVVGGNEKLLVDEPDKYWNKLLEDFKPQYLAQFKDIYIPKIIRDKFKDVVKQAEWS